MIAMYKMTPDMMNATQPASAVSAQNASMSGVRHLIDAASDKRPDDQVADDLTEAGDFDLELLKADQDCDAGEGE
jgi:hypothetical protein